MNGNSMGTTFTSITPTFPILKFPLNHSLISQKPKPKSQPNYSKPLSLFRSIILPTRPSSAKVKINGEMVKDIDNVAIPGDESEEEYIVEACLSKILPPALTLQHGLQALKEELEELKRNPPSCASGMIRFQVAVPPSTKALDWFCSQPKSSKVFPQFYMCKDESSSYASENLRSGYGVFGIGAAVDFRKCLSSSGDWNSFRRYLLVDSLKITAYGFTGINYKASPPFVKPETGSLYFVVPQIELNEYEGFCLLSGTLVWDDSYLGCFKQAVCSYELSLIQVSSNLPASMEQHYIDFTNFNLQHLNLISNEKLRMIYVEDPVLASHDVAAASVSSGSSSQQFCIRLSSETAVSMNMAGHAGATNFSVQNCANISSVWASLVVEECARLGLTYFCIAPGSRSSPLAMAASTHPCITCIVCYDERSLAFHAIGYARGSRTPAVVITTSGTAVSNLFPAVVEASQDFVPLVLFTADRPPELLATGANQAIDQVNHFGSYVRFFFNLPAPSDHVTARMVLTTVDSAVYWATCSPNGPVHINFPFREPLDNSPESWNFSCVDGLEFWMSSLQPFTKYIRIQSSFTHDLTTGLSAEVKEVIHNCKCGLLLIGAIHRDDEIWAALVLAKHLSWPIAADILSGLRIRKLLTAYPDNEENFVFLDHFDHMLLCDSVRHWIETELEVIIQVGSRITSKRISKMLEDCSPCTYIMVDEHPHRHDPSHIVTHRINAKISEFAGCLLKNSFQCLSTKWRSSLQAINLMVAWELSFQIHSENSLTEPHVSHAISEVLESEAALFVGNSMPIRDADMYAPGVIGCIDRYQWAFPFHWIRVAGNRGTSGIDGLLSTATGFAAGCKKRVVCVIGDISFLHDTNGLALLSSRMWRKPITVLVINNRGGGIFSLLPIAENTERQIMEKYFYYNHDISISKLCAAHGVKHMLAESKEELCEALSTSKERNVDCVVEIASSIDTNSMFHSVLKKIASQTASRAFMSLSQLSIPNSVQDHFNQCKIAKVEYSLYGINLSAPPTSVSRSGNVPPNVFRQGFILELTLDDGSTGLGEIAPLDIHKETLLDVEEQLLFLLHALKAAPVSNLLPLLRGTFSAWIWKAIGVPPISIFPSVRCGLEMAILNAMATSQMCTLLDVLWPQHYRCDLVAELPSSIDICALVDSEGTPSEIASLVTDLVQNGFRAVKLKVARGNDPWRDAAVIKEIRKKVGDTIELRVDANRRWTYEEAIKFGSLVKDCNLSYIEEPVQYEEDIIKFCEETDLPVALDETIDNLHGNISDSLGRFTHRGIVALVIKPSVVGGFENAEIISSWAHSKGKMAVVSAAFETSVGLSAYVQFACYLERRSVEIRQALDGKMENCVAHGLGTYKWLKEDVIVDPLYVHRQDNRFVGASIADADLVLRNYKVNKNVVSEKISEEHISIHQITVELEHISYMINVRETKENRNDNVLVFLHGFLGTGEDWVPIMKALSGSAKCIAVDLPGHGRSKILSHVDLNSSARGQLSIEAVSTVLCHLINNIAPRRVTLVGYSMGARIALYVALRLKSKIEGVVVISGSPGIENLTERKIRAAKDDSRACSLLSFGLAPFLNTWYQADLWQSFKEHPSFKKVLTSRSQHADINGLAKALSELSIGRQPSLWDDLKHCEIPMLFIVGEKDLKFKRIGQDICRRIAEDKLHKVVEVPDAGHAVHIENPLATIKLLRLFFSTNKT